MKKEKTILECFQETDFYKKNKDLVFLCDNTIYDKETRKRIGTYFPPSDKQVDTLTYQPLSDKVLQILTGDPTFHAEDVNEDYDEDECEWNDFDTDSEDDLQIDVVSDDYFDNDDSFDLNKELSEKIKRSGNVTKVVEGVDDKSVEEVIEQTSEKTSGQNK